MKDYDTYVKEVNSIFSILEKLKNTWPNNDNLNHIDEINQYKRAVINGANFLGKQKQSGKKEI